MIRFLEEVRYRKVYRVAAAYVVAAGFIIQTDAAIFPLLQLPLWTLRLIVALVLAGFPAGRLMCPIGS
jgi:hypothetical protein